MWTRSLGSSYLDSSWTGSSYSPYYRSIGRTEADIRSALFPAKGAYGAKASPVA